MAMKEVLVGRACESLNDATGTFESLTFGEKGRLVAIGPWWQVFLRHYFHTSKHIPALGYQAPSRSTCATGQHRKCYGAGLKEVVA